jgi:hypothetical protein
VVEEALGPEVLIMLEEFAKAIITTVAIAILGIVGSTSLHALATVYLLP